MLLSIAMSEYGKSILRSEVDFIMVGDGGILSEEFHNN